MELSMPARSHLSAAERRAVSRLHSLLAVPGLLHGSLQANKRRCGKATCRCAFGDLHASLVLRVVQEGRQRSLHVPAEWEVRVREWLERDREVRRLLAEISDGYVARLKERRG
jgi:hypothetical protein